MSKAVYVRAYSNQDQNKCLEVAEKLMERLGLSPKSFYFPTQPNEQGYFSVLVRVPKEMSELQLRAKLSWALQ
jgi:hypothetical protein